ncbi:MAG: hydroxymethylglutaryl-CoA reductase [Proteobacteria bacterium]|nr:hydroxymethylglutaryl-CoA reductase [Pseudomonadota bacterium]
MKLIGPIKIIGSEVNDEVLVPLATFESPLWPSTARGAHVSRMTAGIQAVILKDCMTRSVLVEAPSALFAQQVLNDLENHKAELNAVVAGTSRYAILQDWHGQVVGNLLFLRFSLFTGEASGHNMVTKAADALLTWLLAKFPILEYVSISANICVDKKVSAINGILGRGKYVVAEITVPREVCQSRLKTTPEQMVNLHIKKNLLGTLIAGGIRTANAHFANMLLGFYIATGQDAANIIEGSQGIVHAEVRNDQLYFSVTLPNIIVGAIGNGKHLDFVRQNLDIMGCNSEKANNARRLAIIAAATVLCGEISLLAAQTNQGELMKSHIKLERLAHRQKRDDKEKTYA